MFCIEKQYFSNKTANINVYICGFITKILFFYTGDQLER